MLSVSSKPGSRLVVSVALVICATIFASLPAFAGKPTPGSCSGPYKNDPGCPGGPSQTPPADGSSSIYFDDVDPYLIANIKGIEGGAASCATTANNSEASGNYYCGSVGQLYLNTVKFPLNFNKKYRKICDSFQSGEQVDVDEILYGWTDSCLDGSCGIQVHIFPAGSDISDLTGGASDRAEIILSGSISGYIGADSNPFTSDQTVDIDSIDMVYYKTGTDTVNGVCSGGAQEGIEFYSSETNQPN